MTQENGNVKLVGSVIVVAIIVLVGIKFYEPRSCVAPVVTPMTTTDDDTILGNADAPVTVVIFGDYECPFCKKAYDTAEVQMRKEYVDTGKVKMVFRDYPLDNIHQNARPASEAAQCALPQGKFWEYHDALFDQQEKLGSIDYVKLAGDLGLDTVVFKSCFDNKTYAAEVEADREAGIAMGIEGTPATFINGELVPGAYPYATYKQAIDRALKGANCETK